MASAPSLEQIVENAKPLLVIGGGFAGSTQVLHRILKTIDDPDFTDERPLKIRLLERYADQLYGGRAYGKKSKFKSRLNLSAHRVTPFKKGEKPDDFPSFPDYIRQTLSDPDEIKEQLANPARALYGDYLHHLVDLALKKAGKKIDYDTINGEALDFEETKSKVTVELTNGEKIDASEIVIATGLKDPVTLQTAFNAKSKPNFLDYPYSDEANEFYDRILNGPLNHENTEVLVIGTGLTAMDAAIRLLDNGFKGKIVMTSRRGLMHPKYVARDGEAPEGEPFLIGEPRDPAKLAFTKRPPDFLQAVLENDSFAPVQKAILREFDDLLKQGYSSEEILSHWEQYSHYLFDKYPEEFSNFLLKYETPINVMRVGTTPLIYDKIMNAKAAGRLEIRSSKVGKMKSNGIGFKIDITPTDGNGQPTGKKRATKFDVVISGIGNSTKYDLSHKKIKDRFWSRQRKKNAFRPHKTRDGVEVTHDFSLVDGKGKPYKRVSVLGTPISGHINTHPYPYPEKEGIGARLGAFTLNIQGILGSVLAHADLRHHAIKHHMYPDLLRKRPTVIQYLCLQILRAFAEKSVTENRGPPPAQHL